MPLSVSAANSSSLDEPAVFLFDALVGACRVCRVVVGVGLEGDFPASVAAEDLVAGEGFAAGEKSSFVCRLRSRAFLGAILP
jgi:hypothetical protein